MYLLSLLSGEEVIHNASRFECLHKVIGMHLRELPLCQLNRCVRQLRPERHPLGLQSLHLLLLLLLLLSLEIDSVHVKHLESFHESRGFIKFEAVLAALSQIIL